MPDLFAFFFQNVLSCIYEGGLILEIGDNERKDLCNMCVRGFVKLSVAGASAGSCDTANG